MTLLREFWAMVRQEVGWKLVLLAVLALPAIAGIVLWPDDGARDNLPRLERRQ
jgi:hypothetical protein